MSYYQTLGVQETATPEEIKAAYRRLAKDLHPDRNPNDSSAKDKFQKVQEAYETLGNVDKRSVYDSTRKFSGFNSFNLNDLFSQWNGNWGDSFDRNYKQNAAGSDVRINATFTLEEAYYGCSKNFDLNFDKVKVDFVRGLQNGMVLKVYGRGSYNPYNTAAPRGDLIINILINPDERIVVQGSDMWIDHYLPFYDLILGIDVNIETPFGKYKINIPPKTTSGRVLRIPGKGMPIYRENTFGNLFVKVHGDFSSITDEQMEIIRKIKELE